VPVRKHTVVLEGGQLGALLALSIAESVGLATDRRQYVTRRDGAAQVWAFGEDGDKGARSRWVRECKRVGLKVVPAPWERKQMEQEVDQ
jgi:hypothetical protein